MRAPSDLSGRRIVVTGAASGIGRATAMAVSRYSGRVVGVDADADGLRETISGLDGTGHVAHVCDLRDLASIRSWMTDLAAKGGGLHGLVHAAGLPCFVPLKVMEPETYRDMFTVNTEAALALARGFQSRRVYAGGGGSIVFISSVMALVGSPCVAAYSMSKAALNGIARALALELAPQGIRVNCVAPGFIRTPMEKRVSRFWDEQQVARIGAMHPLGYGEPEDVANAITFLLADSARWITGSVLTVDGGYTAQ